MAAFSYQAYTKNGQRSRGVVEADNERAARRLLRERGLLPEEVKSVAASSKKKKQVDAELGAQSFSERWAAFKQGFFSSRQKVSAADLSLMTRQLATLLAAGIPIDEALSGVAEQTTKANLKAIILGVRAKVLTGYSLAASMEDFPRAFSKLYRVTVSSGEQSGHLDRALLRLADYTEKQQAIRSKVKQALVYPSMMAAVASGVIVFLILYIVPKIITVFQDSHMTLPLPTVILLSISGFLQSYGLYFVLLIIALVFMLKRALRKKSMRRRYDELLLKLPVIGSTMLVLNCARFARTFGILMAAGVPVLEAIANSARLISPLPMRESVQKAVEGVREGGSIYNALRKTKYFPPMFLHLLASGEKSGHLEDMLIKAADNQDNEVEAVLESVLTLFEPIMILVMGAMVLFIVLAVLLPIFSMDQFAG